MLKKNAIVIYKNLPALVKDVDGDKFVVEWCASRASAGGKKTVYAEQRVREKDVVPLVLECGESGHTFLDKMLAFADAACAENSEAGKQIAEVHELLLGDGETASAPISFGDVVDLMKGALVPVEAWGLFSALRDSYEFKVETVDGSVMLVPRSMDEIAAMKKKDFEKEHAEEIRAAFVARLKEGKLLPEDSVFMTEVETVALGKTDKSRVMKDAGIAETPENAHRLLLETGIWEMTRNPYPLRWGLSAKSASEPLPPPPEEERVRIPGISYAIDNAWSNDPDDAIGWDGEFLWVHIADPASAVSPDSKIDKIARDRGATLYIPEGTSMMLAPNCLENYALGLSEESKALSFKIRLADDGSVDSCEVLRTIVSVKRYSYEQADELKESPELKPLFEIGRRNFERRCRRGAVSIEIPEVHITVEPETKKVSIEPTPHPESAEVVREAMLLAGEGAALFAFRNKIPFPFIAQEIPEIPSDIPEGLAGQFRLRRCMRRRSVGLSPSPHGGLGLSMYSQVTSPLRRYGDLISHQQLRSFIRGEKMIDKDEMLMRMSAGEAAAQASKKAERNSRMHWTLVYLLQNPGKEFDAVCVDRSRDVPQFFIPEIGLEIQLASEASLNDVVRVKVSRVDIPTLAAVFAAV